MSDKIVVLLITISVVWTIFGMIVFNVTRAQNVSLRRDNIVLRVKVDDLTMSNRELAERLNLSNGILTQINATNEAEVSK